nr:AlpA family phage regulatory protein [uncultured Amphritea sp.]
MTNTNVTDEQLTLQYDVPDRGVLEKECAFMTGLGRQRRWELEREGRFPLPRKIGPRTNMWLLSEILEWLQDPARYAQRKASTEPVTQ